MDEKLFDLAGIDFAWPKGNDKLAQVNPRSRMAARLDGIDSNCRTIFMEGYRKVADVAVAAVNRNEAHPNFVVWPILMLYRHAIELGLKECIGWGVAALHEDSGLKTDEHRLRVLLDKLREQSGKLFPYEKDGALIGFSTLVRSIDEIDPNGQTVRYPADKNGIPFRIPREGIDLEDLKLNMDKALNFLSGYADAAANLAEVDAEMQAEFESEMCSEYGC